MNNVIFILFPAFSRRPNTVQFLALIKAVVFVSLSLSLYIYMCVCVCVCVCGKYAFFMGNM